MTRLYDMTFCLGDEFHYAYDTEANALQEKRLGEEEEEIYEELDIIDKESVYWETEIFSIHEEVGKALRELEKVRKEIGQRGVLYKFVNEGRVN